MDTLQQMIADTLNKACVEKDEGPEAEILPRLLIVVEGPDYFEGSCQIYYFLFIFFLIVILAQTVLKAHVYFYLFIQILLYMYRFHFQ